MLRVIVPIPDFVWWLRKPLGFLLLAMMVRKLYQASTAVTCLMKRRKALIIAARDGTLSNVKLLLSGTPSSDHAFLLQPEEAWQGVTAVYAAALRGHTVCCKELLLAGAEPDQPNAMGDVPLAIAAQEGHAAIISLLLRSNVAVDRQAPGSGATALQLACMQGHAACVRVLLAGGAATDTANADGNTALFLCCEHGHVECARLLLEAGASIELRWGANNAAGSGATPLFIACIMGHLPCVQLLSSYGARRRVPIPALGRVLSAEEVATERHKPEVVEWLQRTRSWGALHHVEVMTVGRVRALLREGADVMQRLPIVRSAESPPDMLLYGTDHATLDALELATLGPNVGPDLVQNLGPTPLELARRMPKGHAGARLVRRAAQPWSPSNHELFPAEARALACSYLWPLVQLGTALEGGPPPTCFAHMVLSHLITRSSKPKAKQLARRKTALMGATRVYSA